MPEGTFKHSNIGSAPQKKAECAAGWIAHYTIGVIFASGFVACLGDNWLQHPTLLPATIFGVVTVLMPFFVMRPSFGYGFAASMTPNPTQVRLRSLMNHTAFGGVFTYLHCWSTGCYGCMAKKASYIFESMFEFGTPTAQWLVDRHIFLCTV